MQKKKRGTEHRGEVQGMGEWRDTSLSEMVKKRFGKEEEDVTLSSYWVFLIVAPKISLIGPEMAFF